MKLQEFQQHIHTSHPQIWEKMKDTSLQEYYAAAQRHRQEHLKDLRMAGNLSWPPPDLLNHGHYRDDKIDGAPGARDITL